MVSGGDDEIAILVKMFSGPTISRKITPYMKPVVTAGSRKGVAITWKYFVSSPKRSGCPFISSRAVTA